MSEPATISTIFTLANAKWLLVVAVPLAVKVLWDYFSIKRDVKELKKAMEEHKADTKEIKQDIKQVLECSTKNGKDIAVLKERTKNQ